MDNLRRQPTRTEQWLSIVLSAIAALIFGAVAGFLLTSQAPASQIATALFTALAVASAILFFRSAFTRSRALTSAESYWLARVLVVMGSGAIIAALLFADGTNKYGLLGAGLSCFGYGLSMKPPRR